MGIRHHNRRNPPERYQNRIRFSHALGRSVAVSGKRSRYGVRGSVVRAPSGSPATRTLDQCALFREPIAQHCGTKQKATFSLRHRGLPKPDGLSLRRPSRPTLAEATFRPSPNPSFVRVARDTDGAWPDASPNRTSDPTVFATSCIMIRHAA